MRIAAERDDLKLFTLRDEKLFYVRTSQAEPAGLRFDRYVTDTYDTIKRSDVEAGVAAYNQLTPTERLKASNYAGNHHAASYLGAFLVYCAQDRPANELPSNERDLPESSGQGYGLTPKQRKAVEDRGMECASEYYVGLGWSVAPRGKPFDLLCTKATGEHLYVEVKASTQQLEEILVTNGEVKFACANPDHVDLFLLENVQLRGNKASGGKFRAFRWRCDPARITPTHCRYRLA